MVDPRIIGAPDLPNRQVLFAVELVDPFAQSLVHRGLLVTATGLKNRPILNQSGRFVWLREQQLWPAGIQVVPQNAPYAAQTTPAPARPADLDKAPAEQRLARITLRPTRAYLPEDGVTGIRGRLCETAAADAPPIAGVRVQLAWRDDDSGNWLPPKPAPEPAGADDPGADSPREVETDANGEFAALLRLNPPRPARPDIANGLLAVRLQFTRGRVNPVTRATGNAFVFMPDAQAPAGRIPEGQVLARELRLAWADLQPI